VHTYGLHIHVAPQIDSTSLAETIDAVATRLVLVPRFVVLETGPLRTADDHAVSVGAIGALVRRAGIELRVVSPAESSSELLVRAGVLPSLSLGRVGPGRPRLRAGTPIGTPGALAS
jgi:hypothetical protein